MNLVNKLNKFVLSIILVFMLVACQGETSAEPTTEQVQVDESKYTKLAEPLIVSTGDKIEVMELFWYGCGHCFSLETYIKKWKASKPDNVEFVKVPAIFSSRWEFHAKAFYTMEALGLVEEANDAFFHQIHVTRKPISNLDQLIVFLDKYGKNADEVKSAFNSFAVDTKLRNAAKITRASKATGVPAVLVDGKYFTTVSLAGSESGLFDVVDQLAEKAASER